MMATSSTRGKSTKRKAGGTCDISWPNFASLKKRKPVQFQKGLQQDSRFKLASTISKWIENEDGNVIFDVPPYEMSNPIKARVLIINIQEYHATKDHGEHERVGSGKDVDSLCQALYQLGVKQEDIFIYGPTVSRNELERVIKQIASDRKANKNMDVFMMAVFAHGNKMPDGREFITDSENCPVELWNDIVCKFNGRNAPSLIDKPKLFFIQACRGPKSEVAKPIIIEMSNDLPPTSIPMETDMLIAQASAPEYKAYRTPEGEGSYFIQFLANRLCHDAAGLNLELNSILTRVASDVARAEIDDDSDQSEGSKLKQALWWTSSLRKPFYFKQKSAQK